MTSRARRALESPRESLMTARIALARMARSRTAQPDQVDFRAACPECGNLTWWHEERVETRVRIRIDCPCSPESNVVDHSESDIGMAPSPQYSPTAAIPMPRNASHDTHAVMTELANGSEPWNAPETSR